MNRAFLTKLHLVTAAFMFPAVLMFLLTGALYTWGSKGAWHEDTFVADLSQPLTDEESLKDVARLALSSRDLPEPSGAASVDGKGAELSLSWTGARTDVNVAATDDPLKAQVTLREASAHRWLVQLHKAKGSIWFKAYATALAVVLFLLVLSGVVMGLQVKALRRLTVGSSLAGLAAFTTFVMLG